jgi:hypothetical protein
MQKNEPAAWLIFSEELQQHTWLLCYVLLSVKLQKALNGWSQNLVFGRFIEFPDMFMS